MNDSLTGVYASDNATMANQTVDILVNSTSICGMTSAPDHATTSSLSSEDIFLIVLYVLFGSVGIVGNSLVCMVFGLMRSRRSSQINLFIFHQAVVDLCTSCLLILFGITNIFRVQIEEITTSPSQSTSSSCFDVTTSGLEQNSSQPTEVVQESPVVLWQFMCRLWWPRVFLFSMFAISTSNLTTMAAERYIAIMHPFVYATKFSRRHALLAIACIWVIGPFMQYFPAIFQYDSDEHGHCGYQATWTSRAQAAFGFSLTTWEFFIPCVVMGFSSVSIYRRLRDRTKYLDGHATGGVLLRGNGEAPSTLDRSKQMVRANRNTTMVVIAIFVCYVVCWAPNQITFLGFNLGMPLDFSGAWYQTTVLLAFANSCINPVIYALRLRIFKKGLVHVCRSGCKPINSSNFDSTAMANHYDVNASVSVI